MMELLPEVGWPWRVSIRKGIGSARMLGRLKNRLIKPFDSPLPPEIIEPDYPTLNSSLDHDLSPYTGWTRKHWDELATLVLTGTIGFFSPSRTGVHIPGHNTYHGLRVDGLEGYARSLTIAAPWFKRPGGTKISWQGNSVDLLEYYQLGLRNGTDPAHKDYWGDFCDYDQRILEAADIAWSIYIARQYLWDPFSAVEKKQIVSWLRGIIGKKVKFNNWILAKIMINTILKVLGHPYSEQEIQHGLTLVDELYVGNGWYQDGLTESFDYYGAWMFHDYLLKFVFIDGALKTSEKLRYLERSGCFLHDYQHFFAANGSHVGFGRSQIYRSAALGPIVMSALVGGEGLSPGLSRRLASGNLKFFLSHGMFSKQGNLALGFTRSFLPMIESYSCGGSPYLMGRAFSALLLPEKHPFWETTEDPLPVEQHDYSMAIPVAGLLLDGEKRGGHVQVINHKSGNIVEGGQKKYGNFSYSSHFGYEATLREKQYNYDSSLLISRDGKTFLGRQKPFHLQTLPGFGASFFLPFENDETIVYSNVILSEHFQIRVHQVISNRPYAIQEGGYALGYEEGMPSVLSGPDWEFAGMDSRGTFIRYLVGYDHTIPAKAFGGIPNGNNILHPYSLTPGVGLSLGQHRHVLLATLVRGSLVGDSPHEMKDFVQTVQNGSNWLMITLRDGDTIFTQVGTISDRVVQINGVELSGRTTFARVSAGGEIIIHYQKQV